jgi:tRNA threonylcarbamoyladenosine biosynthesis protein TsaB
MNILGFETTDNTASVALLTDETIAETVLDCSKKHSESVLPAAEELLRMQGLSINDIDLFAVDVGPGSFTGVRIGVCLANALGFANNKPIVAVNALEALAESINSSGEPVCVLIDARNGNGYGAVYQDNTCLISPCACEIQHFLSTIPRGCIMTGSACADSAFPKASSIVRLAAKKEGRPQVSPLYLKLSQAERMRHD